MPSTRDVSRALIVESAGLARCLNAVARVKWFPQRKEILIIMNPLRLATPPLPKTSRTTTLILQFSSFSRKMTRSISDSKVHN